MTEGITEEAAAPVERPRVARPTEYIAMPTNLSAAVIPEANAKAAEPVATTEVPAATVETAAPAAEVPAAAAPVEAAAAQVVANVAAAEVAAFAPAPATEPVIEPTAVKAVSQPAPALQESGLVQIETAPEKIAAIAVETSAVRTPPVNRRRARPMEVYVENEPLVQIETQRPQA